MLLLLPQSFKNIKLYNPLIISIYIFYIYLLIILIYVKYLIQYLSSSQLYYSRYYITCIFYNISILQYIFIKQYINLYYSLILHPYSYTYIINFNITTLKLFKISTLYNIFIFSIYNIYLISAKHI